MCWDLYWARAALTRSRLQMPCRPPLLPTHPMNPPNDSVGHIDIAPFASFFQEHSSETKTGHVIIATFRRASSAQGCVSDNCPIVPSNVLDTDARPWLSLRSHSRWPVLSAFQGTPLIAEAFFCHVLLSVALVGLPISWTS